MIPDHRITALGLWPFGDSSTAAADDAAYHALHDAAVAVANARAYGTAQQQAAAATQLRQAKSSATANATAQFQQDMQSGVFGDALQSIQDILTSAGKAAAIGLGIIALFLFGPTLLKMAAKKQGVA